MLSKGRERKRVSPPELFLSYGLIIVSIMKTLLETSLSRPFPFHLSCTLTGVKKRGLDQIKYKSILVSFVFPNVASLACSGLSV